MRYLSQLVEYPIKITLCSNGQIPKNFAICKFLAEFDRLFLC